jgi:hypothetical protein
MQRYRSLAPYLLPLICVAALVCVAAETKESGTDPYTPMKLEWLAMEANARNRDQQFRLGYSIDYHYIVPNTLVINVMLTPECDRKNIDEIVRVYRQRVDTLIRLHEWGNWVEVREEIHVFDSDKRESAQ